MSLKVYNLLAQLVAVPVMAEGMSATPIGQPVQSLELPCGQYTAFWDGTGIASNRAVASGPLQRARTAMQFLRFVQLAQGAVHFAERVADFGLHFGLVFQVLRHALHRLVQNFPQQPAAAEIKFGLCPGNRTLQRSAR